MTKVITPLPTAPSRAADANATFQAHADAFVSAIPGMVSQMNASAIAFLNAPKWVAGTYAVGAMAWSPTDFNTYTRTGSGASATDPASDLSNWQPVQVVLGGGTRILVNSGAAASYDFQNIAALPGGIAPGYNKFEFHLENVIPTASGGIPCMRVYDQSLALRSGASDYHALVTQEDESGTKTTALEDPISYIPLAMDAVGTANKGFSGIVTMGNAFENVGIVYKPLVWRLYSPMGSDALSAGYGWFKGDLNGISGVRFFTNGGGSTIASGRISCYAWK